MEDRASEIIENGDVKQILGMALGARVAADEGRYCECAKPSVHGLDLMCGACLLENREQIVKRTHHIVDAHDFEEPDPNDPHHKALVFMDWCPRCTQPRDALRHHGISATPRYPWTRA